MNAIAFGLCAIGGVLAAFDGYGWLIVGAGLVIAIVDYSNRKDQ